ncbi:MAG TPA: hypothetical protein RMH26_19560, partial [Polyangiaceae bacterium LLY-WYZ-15_(1-7)]|nr:hypothetical protein [Polyangiaceae bacterium LLY-WYZ-15_(1-7)]
EPVVGVMELPISFRFDSEPQNALRVEASPTKLRVNGRTVLELEGGSLPAAESEGESIPALASAIDAAPAASVAALRLYASLPYSTTARIFATLKQKNVREAAIAVRRGQGTEVGWLKLAGFDSRPQSQEPHEFPATHQRPWDVLKPIWQQMREACEAGHQVNCDYESQNVAEGGNMQINLFARGNAMKVELVRFGGPDPEPSGGGGPELIEGIAPAPQAGEEEEAPPATDATFTWRARAATEDDSPISATMRPLCGAEGCGAVIEAEGQTATMRIISFIGAAFPNGSPDPQILFQIPEQ